MNRYTAYGLEIASELALPELTRTDASGRPVAAAACGNGHNPDVVVRLGPVSGGSYPIAAATPLRWARAGDICLSYDGVATYHVTGGSELVIDTHSGADEAVVRLFLLGPVLAVLLHQRGLLVLHASCVSVGDLAVAFVGEKGEGKSTMAAALHARGDPLVADDYVAVDLTDPTRPTVQPGYPQLRLAPEVAEHLGARPDKLPRLHPDFEKRARRIEGPFGLGPVPLARVFVLETGDRESIEPLRAQQRFIELVRHSYLAPLLRDTGESSAHFRQVAALAGSTPILRLQRRRQLERLVSIAALISRNLAGDLGETCSSR